MPVTDPQLVSCSPVLMEWLEPAIAIDRIASGTVDAFGAAKIEE